MNAPLSRYLTRFATEAVLAEPLSAAFEPSLTLTVADLDARLDTARADVRKVAEAAHAAATAELNATHASALADALVVARADWCDGAAGDLVGHVERAFAALHADLAEATAKILRPLMAEAMRERMLAALEEALARLIADPAHPAITLRAPADLVAALRARGVPVAVELVVAETAEAVVSCGGTRIETRLAAALAQLAEA